ISFFLATTVVSYAQTSRDPVNGMGAKFGRGMVNTFTGFGEFPVQISKGWKNGFMGNENNKIGGVAAGFFLGLTHSLGRTFSGFSDLVGFWAADPLNTEELGIHLDSEYVWDKSTPEVTIKKNGFEAMGKKAGMGFSNLLLGFLEIPGQFRQAAGMDEPSTGVMKGLWYFASREWDGMTQLLTAFLPTPADSVGYRLDQEWPWDAFSEADK
ncbi:MAG: hypothetical protein HQ594_05070, partial [Candidatus Omnitrophica bacterium]|nr:hypothetical protein [Candidatus Omnitrophota bacterium]